MNENAQRAIGQSNDLENKDVFVTLTDALHRFFYFRVHDNGIADDLAQETMTRAYKVHPELFEPNRAGEGRSYVYATARHVFANFIRDQQRHQTEELTDSTSDRRRNTDIQLSMDAKLLWAQINKLSTIERFVLHHQFQQGLPLIQIAKKLHKSVNAIKLISSRARAKLKKN